MSVVDAVTARESAHSVADGDRAIDLGGGAADQLRGAARQPRRRGRGAFGLIATGVNRSLQTEALQRTTPGGAYHRRR